MTQAQIAIRAAKNWHNWGGVNAILFCRKRGVPVRLLALARFLEGVK